MKLNDLSLILIIGLCVGIVSVLTKILANTTKSHPIEIVIARYNSLARYPVLCNYSCV